MPAGTAPPPCRASGGGGYLFEPRGGAGAAALLRPRWASPAGKAASPSLRMRASQARRMRRKLVPPAQLPASQQRRLPCNAQRRPRARGLHGLLALPACPAPCLLQSPASVPAPRLAVHDFGFMRFDPSRLQYMQPAEVPLAPQAAEVGLEIRVVGNDSGEKVRGRPRRCLPFLCAPGQLALAAGPAGWDWGPPAGQAASSGMARRCAARCACSPAAPLWAAPASDSRQISSSPCG